MQLKRFSFSLALIVCLLLSARALAQTVGEQHFIYLPIIAKPEVKDLKVIAVGPGGSDVISRQIIRTADDRLYLFANRNGSSTIYSYYTTAAGKPNASSDFAAGPTQTLPGSTRPIAVDAVYDGATTIHVLSNATNGHIRLHPFNTSNNTFGTSTTIDTNGQTMNANDLYVGTMGISGLMDTGGNLHLVYWRNDNHVVHRIYTFNGVNYTQVGGTQVVDTAGSANHPSLAISPADGSVIVAWVSEATNPRRILARVRNSAGSWGAVETVSTAAVWTSTQFGINVDQGPGLVVDASGVAHLTYIQNFDSTGDYGRVHHVTRATNGVWTDTALNFYSHAPAIGVISGQVSIIGHGHPKNPAGPCKSMDDMCFIQKSAGVWGSLQLLYTHPSATSLDASPSVKWSVVGFNRPQTVELVFFSVPKNPNLDYYNPTLHYARLP